MRPLGSFVSYLNRFKDVQYVLTKCLSFTYLPEDALQEALARNIT